MTKRPKTPLLARLNRLFNKPASVLQDSEISQDPAAAQTASESVRSQIQQKLHEDAVRAHELNHLRKVINLDRDIPIAEFTHTTDQANAAHSDKSAVHPRSAILNKIDGAEAQLDQWWSSGSEHAAQSTQPAFPDTSPAQPKADDGELDLDFTGMQELSSDEEVEPTSSVDAGLRKAALLYAEGELEAAKAALLTMLANTALDNHTSELFTASLFDVYRCAGQQDCFNALALDYSNRFGRSPAEWFSLEDQSPAVSALEQAVSDIDLQADLHSFWQCPAILNADSMAPCAALQSTSVPVSAINWFALQHIDSAIAPSFARQMTAWCDNPFELHWHGIESLLAALQKCRLAGDADANQPWWLIQMDVLRIVQREQAFDDLALEYCMAYEVSPPSWKPAASKIELEPVAAPAQAFDSTVPSLTFGDTSSKTVRYASFELRGNMTGENERTLAQLRTASSRVSQITISCAQLGRVDPKAAVGIMTWAKACDAEGCEAQFIHLPRLVLVYFHMLGMDRWASLSAGSH